MVGIFSAMFLVGQTTGSALVALLFGVTHGGPNAVELGTSLSIGLAASFAGIGTLLSIARVRGTRV